MLTRARTLLAGLAVLGLLFAACGGDDDDSSASDDTTTTAPDGSTDEAADDGSTDDAATDGEGEDNGIDECSLLDIESINQLTGETFTKAEPSEDDTCQLTNDAETALLQFSVTLIDEGQTEAEFVADGATACDEGTEVEVDTSYAAAGVACELSGQPAVLVADDGAGALIIGHPSDASLTTEQVVAVINQIMEGIITP